MRQHGTELAKGSLSTHRQSKAFGQKRLVNMSAHDSDESVMLSLVLKLGKTMCFISGGSS